MDAAQVLAAARRYADHRQEIDRLVADRDLALEMEQAAVARRRAAQEALDLASADREAEVGLFDAIEGRERVEAQQPEGS